MSTNFGALSVVLFQGLNSENLLPYSPDSFQIDMVEYSIPKSEIGLQNDLSLVLGQFIQPKNSSFLEEIKNNSFEYLNSISFKNFLKEILYTYFELG